MACETILAGRNDTRGADVTKILLAGIFHETHSFTDDRTALKNSSSIAARNCWTVSATARNGGFLAAASRVGWEVIPTADYLCGATGMVEHEVFEAFWKDVEPVLERARAQGLDGIFLSLHGAMVTTEMEDPDGELLKRIRAIPGADNLPIFGVYDLHATLTEEMGDLSDGLVCYRNAPMTTPMKARCAPPSCWRAASRPACGRASMCW